MAARDAARTISRAVVPQRRATAAVTTASALILTQVPPASLPRAQEITPRAISPQAIEDARRVIFDPTPEAEARDLALPEVIGRYQAAVEDVAQELASDPVIQDTVCQALQQHLGQPRSNVQITELVEQIIDRNGGGGNDGGNVEIKDDDETASRFTKLAVVGAIVLIVGAVVVYVYPYAVRALSSMWKSIWTSSGLAEMVGGASGAATGAATGAASEAATRAATNAAGAGDTCGFWAKLSAAVLSVFFINTKQK